MMLKLIIGCYVGISACHLAPVFSGICFRKGDILLCF